MNTKYFKRDLDKLSAARFQIINLEKDHSDLNKKIEEEELKSQDLLAKNPDIEGKDSLLLKSQDLIIGHLPKLILVIDYVLAYNLLKKYSGAFLEWIPVSIKSLILIICLVLVETGLGYLKRKKKTKKDSETYDDVSEVLRQYDFDEEEEIVNASNEKQRRWAVFASYLFVSILPIVSLSEIFFEFHNIELIASLAEGEEVFTGQNAKWATILKVGGVAFSSLVLHYLVLLYGRDILEAKSRARLRREFEKVQAVIEQLKLKLKVLEKSIMKALNDFYNYRSTHILKYGEHPAIVSDKFSPHLVELYQYVNGIAV